ncbi:MAG: sporulation protein YhbH [Armatimonadota bacterium]
MAIVSVSQADWSLHRKGFIDQDRHEQKIKEAIKKNLHEIVSREDIILSDGKRVVKVPIRSLEQYKFRFDHNKGERVGQGQGGTKVGDVVARDPDDGQGQGAGKGKGQAGDQAGVDYFEAEVDIDELSALIFEDLGLPNLEEKRSRQLEVESVAFKDIRRAGIMANLDKRRTVMENIKRNAMRGDARFGNIRSEDLRFKTWDREVRHESNAVVIAMMDVSGSMGEFEKYIARSFYFWMVRFLRTKYENVEIVFISHHTEAKIVSEEEFFTKGESGGTRVSSAYSLALETIQERYRPEEWNIYPFHFSDGDNMFSDNRTCVELVHRLLEVCNLFGYGQIKQGWYPAGTLMSVYSQEIDNDKFVAVTIEDKEDVYPALRKFFALRSPIPA